jgi:hypothetical protein
MPNIGYAHDFAVVLNEPKRGVGDKPLRQSDALGAIGQAGQHSVEVVVLKGQNKRNQFLAALMEFGDEASI